MPRPQVGIFWYDESRRELFGALSEYKTYTSCDWTGMKSYPGLHRDVWKAKQNEYFDADGKYAPDDKYPNAASNPWCAEDYTQVPRGRIYTDGETFFVYVGTWFDKDSEHITSLIMATYGLDEEKYPLRAQPALERRQRLGGAQNPQTQVQGQPEGEETQKAEIESERKQRLPTRASYS